MNLAKAAFVRTTHLLQVSLITSVFVKTKEKSLKNPHKTARTTITVAKRKIASTMLSLGDSFSITESKLIIIRLLLSQLSIRFAFAIKNALIITFKYCYNQGFDSL
jgi:hypothetical protein